MNAILIVITGLVLLAILAQTFFAEKRSYRYKARKYLLTNSEIDCYRKLIEAYGKNYIIVPQVRLSSILDERIKGQNWKAARARISQKSVDFVVLDRDSFAVLAAIECDDPSHSRSDRVIRDTFVNQVFRDSGIPLYRLTNTLHKDSKIIKKDIDNQKLKLYNGSK